MLKPLCVVAFALSAAACSKGGDPTPASTAVSGAKAAVSQAASAASAAGSSAASVVGSAAASVVGSAAALMPASDAVPADATGADAEAGTIFAQRCVACHGADGKGDGPASAALNPKPRAFGDPDWQASVTDEHLAKVIVGGGPAVGKSPMMAPNPDLGGDAKKPVLDALVKRVRAFKP
jgi:mono/diheme cytochrome c family protein